MKFTCFLPPVPEPYMTRVVFFTQNRCFSRVFVNFCIAIKTLTVPQSVFDPRHQNPTWPKSVIQKKTVSLRTMSVYVWRDKNHAHFQVYFWDMHLRWVLENVHFCPPLWNKFVIILHMCTCVSCCSKRVKWILPFSVGKVKWILPFNVGECRQSMNTAMRWKFNPTLMGKFQFAPPTLRGSFHFMLQAQNSGITKYRSPENITS